MKTTRRQLKSDPAQPSTRKPPHPASAPPAPVEVKSDDPRLKNIRIVLSHPIYARNVGYVCRVMANMGLSDLRLVGTLPGDLLDARKMACWANNILDARKEVATLADAVGDCCLVMGATARAGLYRQHAKTPREWAPDVLAAAQNGKVAMVFGPEDNGLNNEELALCSRLIQIPSAPAYRSLNLSHAVMICAYEIFVATATFEPLLEKSPWAPSALKERLFDLWEKALLEIGFMQPDKARHMMLGVRRIFERRPLTEDDVRILMGIARQTRWCAGQLPAGKKRPAADLP